jgi:transposase InsO family protein
MNGIGRDECDHAPVWRNAQREPSVVSVPAVGAGGRARAIDSLVSCVVQGESGHLRHPMVFINLRVPSETYCKHRVARLMRKNHLRALHGFSTRRLETGKPAVLTPNPRIGPFSPRKPNAACETRITFMRTWQGCLQLAVVIDLLSRRANANYFEPSMDREGLC